MAGSCPGRSSYIFSYGDVPLNRVSFSGFLLTDKEILPEAGSCPGDTRILLWGRAAEQGAISRIPHFYIREFTKPGRRRKPELHLIFYKESIVSVRYL